MYTYIRILKGFRVIFKIVCCSFGNSLQCLMVLHAVNRALYLVPRGLAGLMMSPVIPGFLGHPYTLDPQSLTN